MFHIPLCYNLFSQNLLWPFNASLQAVEQFHHNYTIFFLLCEINTNSFYYSIILSFNGRYRLFRAFFVPYGGDLNAMA
jgi:hypothetical protein